VNYIYDNQNMNYCQVVMDIFVKKGKNRVENKDFLYKYYKNLYNFFENCF